jgi:hypothetical protein
LSKSLKIPKGVIGSSKSKKDRHYNGQRKSTNYDLENIQKTKELS